MPWTSRFSKSSDGHVARAALSAAQALRMSLTQDARPELVAKLGEIDAPSLATRLAGCSVEQQVGRFGER